MSINTVNQTNGCTFQWEIVNISHCWLKKEIESPKFIADALEDTKWWLRLQLMSKADENYISFYLHRDKDCKGPDVIKVNYQIRFINEDYSILKQITESNVSFVKPDNRGYAKFLARERVFGTEKEVFVQEDTLTIQCTIWNKNKPIKPKYLFGRTVFKVHRKFLTWRIDGFSNVQYGLRKKFKDRLFNFDLVLNENINGIDICIISIDKDIRYISYKTAIIDLEGGKKDCGVRKYFPGDLRKFVLSSMLLFPKKFKKKKRRYIPNDTLTLEFEFVFSRMQHFECVENSNVGKEFHSKEYSQEKTQDLIDCSDRADWQKTNVLIDDLQSMYYDGIFSDTELRTSTKVFPVHRNILSARSAVFRSMFSHDMKEANSRHVDITDFEDDTIHRMLLYMYTDSLADLQLESASKLYIAADKYRILSLKSRCSSFIKNNLSPAKACSILVLADLYQDNDLKSFVETYILDHDKEIIGCQKWKDFMNTHPKLAAYVMYRKFFPD